MLFRFIFQFPDEGFFFLQQFGNQVGDTTGDNRFFRAFGNDFPEYMLIAGHFDDDANI